MTVTVDTMQVSRPDGARLEIQISGPSRAPALLLLQGQASSHTWWADLRHRYENRFRTITMDYRGTGRTSAPPGELSTQLLAGDAVAALDAAGALQAHVYGTSMGGRVAQMLAAHSAERVETLVLACTSPGGPNATERDNDVRRALANPDARARTATMIELLYTPAWGGDATRARLFGDPAMSVIDRQRHLRMSARHDAWDLLAAIACPTLVLHGAADRMTPSINGEVIAERIPNAELQIHPTGRHGFFDEFADEIDRDLRSFWT